MRGSAPEVPNVAAAPGSITFEETQMNRWLARRPLFRAVVRGGLGLCALGVSGCVVREREVVTAPPPQPAVADEVVVTDAPPPEQTEIIGVAPAPGYVWMSGYYAWRGGRYVWFPGRWARPPRPGVVWIGGHWDRRPHGWVYVGGYWR